MIAEAYIEYSRPVPRSSAPKRRQKWSLTKDAFDQLLLHLHPNRESAGEAYEETRRKLVKFFESRGASLSEALADETLDRVIKRFEDGVVMPNFQSYCFGVARMLHLEVIRKQRREREALSEFDRIALTDSADKTASQEILDRLERLMDELPAKERSLLIAYYQSSEGDGIETRQRLAEQLGIAVNAVRIRVHRIRRKLEARFQAEPTISQSLTVEAHDKCWRDP